MKYLSKLLSVLLMGVMLYSTGCADYDEDIKSINNRIDQLVSGEIQPLKADLAKVKSDLEAAIAAAQAELKNIHDVDIANLKAADEALAEDANAHIRQYAAYYPQTAEAFMYDFTNGQSYTVSCGGMRATTTVRTQN